MSKNNDDVIKTAHERFDLAMTASAEFRKQAKEDMEFLNGEQWTQAARDMREKSGQPCYTVNKVKALLQRITNEMRQNKPSIQVDPTSDDATRDIADVFAGMIRNIEQDSASGTAYDTAGMYAAATGEGFFRLVAEYEDETSFDQKLVIKTVEDPSTVFFDPNSKEADGSDAEWAFIVTDIPKDTYKRMYGDNKLAKAMNSTDFGSLEVREGWMDGNTVRIGEYFYKEYTPTTIYAVRNTQTGETLVVDEAPPEHLTQGSIDEFGNVIPALVEVKGSRKSNKCRVKWCKIDGVEILEETDWPSKHIPVFPVKGDENWVAGKRHKSGAIRHAKDSQRAYNWFASVQTELIAMSPKTPFIGEKGAFAGFENRWRDANVKNFAYLEFNGKDAKGNPIAAPARMSMDAPIQAVAASRGQAGDDIQSVFGIFDAAQGAQGNETSGKAILARTHQSEQTTYHYYDNLIRTITHLGKVLVDVIPHYYDSERMVKIVKANGERETVAINTIENGVKKNDLCSGRYDVVIETGPSYATRRQEGVTSMMALIDGYPTAAPLIADLVVNDMDWPGADIIAKRLRAAVPPEILAATGEGDEEKMEPAQKVQMLTQQLQQAQQGLEALNAHSHNVEQMLHLKEQENKLLKEDKEIDRMKAELEFRIKSRGLDIDEQTTALEFEIKQRELALSEKKLELESGKLAISAMDSMHEVNKSMHDAHKEHHAPEVSVESIDTTANDPDLGGKFE